jgi:hypothetical protein
VDPQAAKFVEGSTDRLKVLAIPFGGPDYLDGSDLDGERFTAKTDLCNDWYTVSRPLLFQHGLDEDATGVTPVGKVDSSTLAQDDLGWWVEAQLDRQSRYFAHIARLVEQKKLYASSGAYSHLVRKAKDGEILRWPWVELSLTPTPANPLALVEAKAVREHYLAAGITPPPTIDADDARTWGDLLDTLADDVAEFAAGTRRYTAMRAKVGRPLSEARRRRLTALAERMRESASEVEALLAETGPAAAEAEAEAAAPDAAAPTPDAPPAEEKAVPAAPAAGTAAPEPNPSVAEGAAGELTAIFAKFRQDAAYYERVLATPR